MPLEYLVEKIGWQQSLHVIALGGVLIGAAILILVAKTAPYHASKPEDEHILEDVFTIIKKPQAWLIAIFGMLMYLPLTLMGDLWGVSFLESKYQIPESLATVPVLCMFIGIAIGAPIFAWATYNLRSRKLLMIIGSVTTFLIYMIILFAPSLRFELLCVLLFLAGFLFNGQTMVFTSICEIMPLHASGVSVGFVNMIIMLNGLIFLPIVGKILVLFWDGTMANGVPVYGASDYQVALSIIPICLGLSILLATGIRETFEVLQEA
jgi:predicted MFS family arabinose efflux permease